MPPIIHAFAVSGEPGAATRSLRIEASTLDEEVGTIGAVALAQQRVLSPAGLAASGVRIEGRRPSC